MTNHAEDKRKYRESKRKKGYVLKQIWVKPDSWKEIKKIVDDKSNPNKA